MHNRHLSRGHGALPVAADQREADLVAPVSPRSEAAARIVSVRPAPQDRNGSVRPTLDAGDVRSLGEQLSTAITNSPVEFHFDLLANPTPRVHHSSVGGVYVTTGLLERMADANELVVLLAIEMAEILLEHNHVYSEPIPPDAPAGGDTEPALVHTIRQAQPVCAGEQVLASAQEILHRAERRSVDVAKTFPRFQHLYASRSWAAPMLDKFAGAKGSSVR
jgi:hypothetical protein